MISKYESTISAKEEREGEPPNLQDKVTLEQGAGRSWSEIAQAQLQAQQQRYESCIQKY